jgi:nitroimidazol reductase NimA-like FMN-containing flavoprotein (pyridoxamine 5'-phosphate oxidase superfamily)
LLKKVLKSTKYVTVALCMDNEPYLVSLSHGYDEKRKCLYFHCADEGKKLVYMKANSKVWGQAVLDYGVTDECDYAYTSVHFKGNLSLIDDLSEKQHAMEVWCGSFPRIQRRNWLRLNLKNSQGQRWAESTSSICQVRSIRNQNSKFFQKTV